MLDEVAYAVAVGVGDDAAGLAGVELAIAVEVLAAVDQAVVVAVDVDEVGRAVAIGVDGR